MSEEEEFYSAEEGAMKSDIPPSPTNQVGQDSKDSMKKWFDGKARERLSMTFLPASLHREREGVLGIPELHSLTQRLYNPSFPKFLALPLSILILYRLQHF